MVYDDLKSRIAGVSVRNLEGEPVALESLWADRTILLVFLRHFG